MKRIYKFWAAATAALILAALPISVSANEQESTFCECNGAAIKLESAFGECDSAAKETACYGDLEQRINAEVGTTEVSTLSDSDFVSGADSAELGATEESTAGENESGAEGDRDVEKTPDRDSDGTKNESGANEITVFENIYNTAMAHASEILSALAFVASMIIAIGYKKGLVPLLRHAANRISESVDKTREDTEEELKKREEILKEKESTEALLKSSLEELSGRVSTLCDNLSAKEKLENCTEKLRIVILSQIDLLYDVFMSSALPQYQKELIGERVVKMKKEMDQIEK